MRNVSRVSEEEEEEKYEILYILKEEHYKENPNIYNVNNINLFICARVYMWLCECYTEWLYSSS